MKRYIKNASESIIHITDLFDSIESIVYTDDIFNYRHSIICSSENIDYMGYSDENLISLPKDELHSITDLDTLDRLYSLDKGLLTKSQKDRGAERFGER